MKDAKFEQPRKAMKTEKDPVAAYKLYAKKRRTEMNDGDAPFYLAVINCTKQESSKLWFKTSAVGQRKLNTCINEENGRKSRTWSECEKP